jgi:hypothetical protein
MRVLSLITVISLLSARPAPHPHHFLKSLSHAYRVAAAPAIPGMQYIGFSA